MSEDDCEPCTAAAAVSVANMLCKDLEEINVDCGRLFEEVTEGRASVGSYLDTVMDLARGTKLEESMDEVLQVYRSKVQ